MQFIATANNVESFSDKIYTISYNEEQVEAISLQGNNIEDSLDIGIKGDVNIYSYQPGEIQFGIIDRDIIEGELWSGILNVFKFKFKPDYYSNSELIFSEV